MSTTLVQNGTIVTASDRYEADVYIEKGVVTLIGRGLSLPADTVVEASGKLVMPGGLDVHTHLDMPSNLQTLRVLQEFGLEDPNLQARVDRTLDDTLDKLLTSQNEDGGWGRWLSDESDTYVTAYVLYGLVQAQEGGVST